MILTSAAISIFIVSYALIATERVHRVAAALGGVAAMVVIGVVMFITLLGMPIPIWPVRVPPWLTFLVR